MRETKVADYRYDTDYLIPAVFPPAKLQEEDCHYENTEQGYLLLRLPALIHYCSQLGYYHPCIVLYGETRRTNISLAFELCAKKHRQLNFEDHSPFFSQ